MGSRTAEELEQKLQHFFATDGRFRYVETFPAGATGECICFEETQPSGQTRKIVLKYPGDGSEETLDAMNNEIKWIGVLKHAEHIVNPIQIPNGPNEGLTGLDRVFIILQHLENGSLNQFIERTEDIVLPNRILWSLFLCLTRACVAMAWPPGPGEAEEPKPNVAPSNLAHWDMHGGNMLFGGLDGRHEHSLVPVLKLIDFDNAAEVEGEDQPNPYTVRMFDEELELWRYRRQTGVSSMGIRANVLDVGLTMTRVIFKYPILEVAECREFMQHEHPFLDDDLQLLIIRCLAADPQNRPKLDELLETTFNAVHYRTYINTPLQNLESDAHVREIVQRYILDPEDD